MPVDLFARFTGKALFFHEFEFAGAVCAEHRVITLGVQTLEAGVEVRARQTRVSAEERCIIGKLQIADGCSRALQGGIAPV
jgi:hypothetical protein